MKKILIPFILILLTSSTHGQWITNGPAIYYNGGNVGIGTTTPSPLHKLHISGNALITNDLTIFRNQKVAYDQDYTTHGYTTYNPSGGEARFTHFGYYGISLQTRTGGMIIRGDNGRIGVGTNAPDRELHITNSTGAQIKLQSTASGNWSGLEWSAKNGIFNGYSGILDADGRYFIDVASNGEDLTILQNGSIGINDANPVGGLSPDTNRKLMVNGGITVPYGQKISYDKDYYVHAYSSYDASLHTEARFRNYGYYGITLESRNGSLVLRGDNGFVGIGTTSPTEKLSVDGNILAKKVRVSIAAADWPDYIFAPNYELRSLGELENFIKTNQHLPEVPSAKEVATNGLDLGAMDATLLKKVEELTLYLIEQDKSLKAQAASLKKKDNRINKLETENQELKDRLTKIEALIKTLTSK